MYDVNLVVYKYLAEYLEHAHVIKIIFYNNEEKTRLTLVNRVWSKAIIYIFISDINRSFFSAYAKKIAINNMFFEMFKNFLYNFLCIAKRFI